MKKIFAALCALLLYTDDDGERGAASGFPFRAESADGGGRGDA